MQFINIVCSLFLYCIFSIGCKTSVQPIKYLKNDSITAITISRNFPWMTNDGKLLSYEPEKAFIFYKQGLVLYKAPYVHKIFKLSDSAIYEVDKVEERTKYFIYQKGSPVGYFTDSSLNIHFLQCPTDSMLAQFWPTHPFMESSFNKNYVRSIDSLTYRRGKSYYYAYVFQNREDTLKRGIYKIEYSNVVPAIDYSISSQLDTMKGLKLTSIEIFNEARYMKEYNITIDAVRQNRTMALLKDFNRSEIAPFFEFLQRQKIKE